MQSIICLFWNNFHQLFAPAFPLKRVAGVAASGGLEIRHGFQQSLTVLAPHQDGTKQGWRCNYMAWPCRPLGLFPMGVTSRTCLASFLEQFGHMAEPTQLGSLYLEKCFDIQDFTIFAAAHFVAKCHTVNSTTQISHLRRLYLRYRFQTLLNIHDHRCGSEQRLVLKLATLRCLKAPVLSP